MIPMTKYRWIFSQTCHDNATTALLSDWWCSRFRRTTRANTFACSAAVAAAATVRKTRPAPAFWSNIAWCKACLPPGIVNCTHNQIVWVFLVSIERGSKALKYAFFEFHMQKLKGLNICWWMTQTIREAWCWGGVLSMHGFKVLILAYSTWHVLIWSQRLVIVHDNLCQLTKPYCSNNQYRFIFNIVFNLAGSRTDTQRVDLPAGAQMLHKLSTQQHHCVASQQSALLQLHWQTGNIKMHTLSTARMVMKEQNI